MTPTMGELTDGTRVRHIAWEVAGTIRDRGDFKSVRWDDLLADDEVGPEGPVFLSDIEIIEPAAGEA